MTAWSKKISNIIRSQENNIVSATKALIVTHVAENPIKIIQIIVRKTTTASIPQRKNV